LGEAVLTERQIDFISIAATLYLPQGHDVKSFFRSVGNRLSRNPSDSDVRAAVSFVLACRGIALGNGVLAKQRRP
jgi:hypothetical protein